MYCVLRMVPQIIKIYLSNLRGYYLKINCYRCVNPHPCKNRSRDAWWCQPNTTEIWNTGKKALCYPFGWVSCLHYYFSRKYNIGKNVVVERKSINIMNETETIKIVFVKYGSWYKLVVASTCTGFNWTRHKKTRKQVSSWLSLYLHSDTYSANSDDVAL